MPRRRQVVCALAVLCALVVPALAGCAPAADTGAANSVAASAVPSTSPAGAPTDDGGEDATSAPVADGPDDPAQATRRTGPVAEYGGPPYGLQGEAEALGAGSWCATVGLFWGGAAAPENVTFTITGTAASPVGALTSTAEGCGSIAPGVPCLGFTMAADTPFTACSVTLAETAQFAGSAEATFVGTLECTEADFCDSAQTREAEPGPPIVITAAPDAPEGG